MSAVQRDYFERMIEQAAQALGVIAQLIRAGEFDPALLMVQRTSELVLGPLQRVLERLDAASAVEMVGKLELDRIRVYAALLGEEGAIHEAGGRAARAQDCYRRALELYAAISLAGAKLKTADWERIVLLHSKVASDQVEIRYRDELRRLAGRRAPSD